MAAVPTSAPAPATGADPRAASPRTVSSSLAAFPLRSEGVIVAVPEDAETAHWLAAVGLSVGEEVQVLRRALFGGPLHVRTGSGGEFAIARALGDEILVSPTP